MPRRVREERSEALRRQEDLAVNPFLALPLIDFRAPRRTEVVMTTPYEAANDPDPTTDERPAVDKPTWEGSTPALALEMFRR